MGILKNTISRSILKMRHVLDRDGRLLVITNLLKTKALEYYRYKINIAIIYITIQSINSCIINYILILVINLSFSRNFTQFLLITFLIWCIIVL